MVLLSLYTMLCSYYTLFLIQSYNSVLYIMLYYITTFHLIIHTPYYTILHYTLSYYDNIYVYITSGGSIKDYLILLQTSYRCNTKTSSSICLENKEITSVVFVQPTNTLGSLCQQFRYVTEAFYYCSKHWIYKKFSSTFCDGMVTSFSSEPWEMHVGCRQ